MDPPPQKKKTDEQMQKLLMPWFGSEVCSFHWDIFTDCLATVLTPKLKERIAGDPSRDCFCWQKSSGSSPIINKLVKGLRFNTQRNPENVFIELVGIGIIPDEVSGTQDEVYT